ncbi:hypothetical protein C8R43DRAFT_1127511 [Mycena crocata]|nr:hypothetical protein C8R43DRAFT_1127511 [Mycena crocata]
MPAYEPAARSVVNANSFNRLFPSFKIIAVPSKSNLPAPHPARSFKLDRRLAALLQILRAPFKFRCGASILTFYATKFEQLPLNVTISVLQACGVESSRLCLIESLHSRSIVGPGLNFPCLNRCHITSLPMELETFAYCFQLDFADNQVETKHAYYLDLLLTLNTAVRVQSAWDSGPMTDLGLLDRPHSIVVERGSGIMFTSQIDINMNRCLQDTATYVGLAFIPEGRRSASVQLWYLGVIERGGTLLSLDAGTMHVRSVWIKMSELHLSSHIHVCSSTILIDFNSRVYDPSYNTDAIALY